LRSIASLQRIGKYDSARRFSRAPRIWTFLNSLEAEFFNALLTPVTRLAVNCNVTRNCASLFCDNAHRRDFGFRRRLAVKLGWEDVVPPAYWRGALRGRFPGPIPRQRACGRLPPESVDVLHHFPLLEEIGLLDAIASRPARENSRP
jgi:hypothetical protein